MQLLLYLLYEMHYLLYLFLQELKKEQGSRNKAWKLKIGSLKRQEATHSEKNR